MKLRLFVTVSGILLLICASLLAGSRGGIIILVKDTQGNPIAGASMTIVHQNYGHKHTFVTDENGRFKQMGLEVGLYTANVEKEGYQSLQADFRVKLGKPRESEFTMEKLQVVEMQFVTKIGDFEITPEVKSKFEEAQAAYKEAKYEEAKTLFEEIVGMMPELPEPYQFLFAIYKEEGMKDKALSNIQKYLERKPEDAGAHMECAYLLEDEGKIDEAEGHYKKVLEVEPNAAGACKQLGLLLLKKGMFKECQTHLKRYLELNPKAKDADFIEQVLQGLEPYLAGGCK